MKNVVILGSTGSIGRQTMEVIAQNDTLRPVALAAGENIELLEAQIRQFRPQAAAVYNAEKAAILKDRVHDMSTEVFAGEDGVRTVASQYHADITVTAMVGNIGILPTLDAIEAGSDIALANKETMVCAGDLVRAAAQRKQVRIIPVDSEHSAIFQCIGDSRKHVKRIFLTASGGPFFGKTKEELRQVCVEDALRHPNWSMGAKITVDSATLINKGLEVIEAVQLFGVTPDEIEVLVHRQSIVHSMVEFCDHSVLAQMGLPDMKVPIAYALSYPTRAKNCFPAADFTALGALTFEKPDTDTFEGLALGFAAARAGGTMPTVFNSANEEAVALFLNGKCTFLEITEFVKNAMQQHETVINPDLACIIEADRSARAAVRALQKERVKA